MEFTNLVCYAGCLKIPLSSWKTSSVVCYYCYRHFVCKTYLRDLSCFEITRKIEETGISPSTHFFASIASILLLLSCCEEFNNPPMEWPSFDFEQRSFYDLAHASLTQIDSPYSWSIHAEIRSRLLFISLFFLLFSHTGIRVDVIHSSCNRFYVAIKGWSQTSMRLSRKKWKRGVAGRNFLRNI